MVTGANSGIGYEAARALAQKGARVILAARSQTKLQQAADKMRAESPGIDIEIIPLDLADLDSIKTIVDKFQQNHDCLDVLINNAGVMAIPERQLTADGFERQFGTNHLGHFALTGLLMDELKCTPSSRVVTVSSYAHLMGSIDFDNLNSEKSYSKWNAYGASKLANILFAYELGRKMEADGRNPISAAAHPGYAATNLQHTTALFSFLNPIMAQSAEMGALPTLYAATAPDVQSGDFIGPDGFLGQRGYPKKVRSSRSSYDKALAGQLWAVSENLTDISYN